ncbi:hypothetical protein Nmel_008517 [Mimus melanotis]
MLCTVSLPGGTPLEIHLRGLLDTGAEITIFSLAAWSPGWPLDPVGVPGAGLGRTMQCYVSQRFVMITNQEGQTAMIRPHHASTSTNLWGRDVLSPWEMCIRTDF